MGPVGWKRTYVKTILRRSKKSRDHHEHDTRYGIYNSLGQLTNITDTLATSPYTPYQNLTYNYPTNGTNIGKISSISNAISGETVTYTYDSLNRLNTASGSINQV